MIELAGGSIMPKDPTKNVDRYKIRGGQLNEFELHQNQEEYVKDKSLTGKQLIPVQASQATTSTKEVKTTKSTKGTKATKGTKGSKATKGTKGTKASKAVTGASAKKLAARKTAKKK